MPFSRVKTWTTNEILTASDLNAEFDNVVTNVNAFLNLDLTDIDDASSNATNMQAVTSPGAVGSESLATDALGEVQRLRYVIKRLVGAQWYTDPGRYLTAGNLAVATADINSSAVTTAKIADSNVTTAKIADSNVTTAKIADGAITNAKLVSYTPTIASGCGAYTGTATVATQITNQSISVTTYGRPVMLCIVPAGGQLSIGIEAVVAGGSMDIRWLRAGSPVAQFQFAGSFTSYLGGANGPFVQTTPNLIHIDQPAAGTYTYTLDYKVTNSTAFFNYFAITAVLL
jgi:hypothetical protein